MATYTAWPVYGDVTDQISMLGVTLRAAITTAKITEKIDAVAAQVLQLTKRQFVAGSAGEIRYFDGSGAGVQEVDEYVAFTAVEILGLTGAGTLSLSNVIEDTQNLYPKTRIAIFRGSTSTFSRIYVDRFPQGRQNIKVTGTWGYGSTIPKDLWDAVLMEVTGRIVAINVYDSTGRVKSAKLGDESIDVELNLPAEVNGWHLNFLKVCEKYKKPSALHLNRIKSRMI